MSSDGNLQQFLPISTFVPEKWEDARAYLNETFQKIANQSNAQEIGWFINQEVVTGKQFVEGTNGNFRTVFRKVVPYLSGLPNSGTANIAHGITVGSTFSIISLKLCASDRSTPSYFALEYYSLNAADSIRVDMDATNINVITTANYSGYTINYFIIEYMQED